MGKLLTTKPPVLHIGQRVLVLSKSDYSQQPLSEGRVVALTADQQYVKVKWSWLFSATWYNVDQVRPIESPQPSPSWDGPV